MATYKRGSGNYKSSYLTIISAVSGTTVNNSEALVNTELVHPLKANKIYFGYVQLRVISPAAADMDYTFVDITGAVNDVFGLIHNTVETPSFFGTQRSLQTDGANQIIMIQFFVRMGSTVANLQFQMAQKTATVGDTKILSDSHMVIFET